MLPTLLSSVCTSLSVIVLEFLFIYFKILGKNNKNVRACVIFVSGQWADVIKHVIMWKIPSSLFGLICDGLVAKHFLFLFYFNLLLLLG